MLLNWCITSNFEKALSDQPQVEGRRLDNISDDYDVDLILGKATIILLNYIIAKPLAKDIIALSYYHSSIIHFLSYLINIFLKISYL